MARGALSVTFTGQRETIRAMQQLKASAQRRIARPAVRAGLSPINKQAKRTAPKDTGLLKKSIGIRMVPARRTRTPGAVIGFVGPRGGFRKRIEGKIRNPTKYSHLVEFGWRRDRVFPTNKRALSFDGIARASADAASAAGTFFLTKAFRAKVSSALARFNIVAAKQLQKEIIRARRPARVR